MEKILSPLVKQIIHDEDAKIFEKQPQAKLNPLLISVIIIILLTITVYIFRSLPAEISSIATNPTEIPIISPTLQPQMPEPTNETLDNKIASDSGQNSWPQFNDLANQVSFSYPPGYQSPKVETSGFISLISPLNTTRVGKGYELQDGELKVEIIITPARKDDSLVKFMTEQKEISHMTVIMQRPVTISGVSGMLLDWEGLGTGQTYYLITEKNRILINKYPAKTARDPEFEKIIKSLTLPQ